MKKSFAQTCGSIKGVPCHDRFPIYMHVSMGGRETHDASRQGWMNALPRIGWRSKHRRERRTVVRHATCTPALLLSRYKQSCVKEAAPHTGGSQCRPSMLCQVPDMPIRIHQLKIGFSKSGITGRECYHPVVIFSPISRQHRSTPSVRNFKNWTLWRLKLWIAAAIQIEFQWPNLCLLILADWQARCVLGFLIRDSGGKTRQPQSCATYYNVDMQSSPAYQTRTTHHAVLIFVCNRSYARSIGRCAT